MHPKKTERNEARNGWKRNDFEGRKSSRNSRKKVGERI